MLARAARRKLRKDACTTPTTPTTLTASCARLTPPWLCPARLRRTSTLPSITTYVQDATRRRTRPLSPRHEARSLATTAELQPAPPSPSFNPFASPWAPQAQQPPELPLQSWHTDPLVVRDSLATLPALRGQHGLGADPVELHQNLYACLRVGRVDRAAAILERLTAVYVASAPEMVDAHNIFLQTLFELAVQDPRADSMEKLDKWYNVQMEQKGIQPNAHTFVTLMRAAMNLLEGDAQEAAVRTWLAMAHECGPDMVDDINASPEFSDEEWDTLIRLQPETYEDPPPVCEVQDLQASNSAARKSLIEHGLSSPTAQPIKPVPQTGVGLESLKQALSIFDIAEKVPYPHDMEGTKEEKDKAYAFARQLCIEQDCLDAAVDRWRYEDEKLQAMGVHGVLNAKPIQAIMYNWYTALIPLFAKQIAHSKKVLSAPIKDNPRDASHSYGAWLERCKPEKLAAITAARVVNSCVRGRRGSDDNSLKISVLSIAIGSDIQKDLQTDIQARRAMFIKKQRRETRRDLVNKLSKVKATSSPSPSLVDHVPWEKVEMSVAARTKLGAMCLELLLSAAKVTVTVDDPKTGEQLSNNMAAFHHQVVFHQGKNVGFIVPHHELMAKLRTDAVHNIETVKLPMVTEPKAWSTFDSGGYYTTPQKVVRQKYGDTAQRAYAQSAIENGDMTKVLQGLDSLGRVPWQINAQVFQVMTQVWNSGENVGSIVPEDTGLVRPVEPPADATYQDRAKWGKKLKEYENLKSGLHSQRCFQNFQLETARAFVNEKKIFFPHSVDFRGRAYPLPPILNHIGSDVARGLLKFAHGKELGIVGLQWLKIHLANLYGFDKASLREREQFSMDNIDEIYDSATNPLDGRRWWSKAEDPWQCLACCMELTNALDSPDPTRYLSQLPVHQDGTCNGLQHYAALGGDYAGARQVNLEPSDRPQDIYTGVAEMVKEAVSKEAAEGNLLAAYVDGHITRKVVKRTVMTNVYGVTFIGAKQQVLDELQGIFPHFVETDKIRSLDRVAMYVVQKIFEALGRIFNGAQEIQYWLGECGHRITSSITAEQIKHIQARYEETPIAPYADKFKAPKKMGSLLTTKIKKNMETLKTSIIWTTPLKMPIVQPYRKDNVQTIKTKIQDITIARRSQSDAVDRRKQLQAFPPNFIHSLDATHMILSALKCSEMGLDFAAVHDSFWTHACDIPNLNVILRDAFVRMHSEDIVNRMAAEFAARYAGAMYRATLLASSDVSSKISKWRTLQRHHAGKTFSNSNSRRGEATFEEVALESRRLELLKSDDPEERKKGEEMVTPTSIWLANPDTKAFSSFRLDLIGERKDKVSRDRQEQVKDKVMTAEAEAVANSDDVEAVSTVESTVTIKTDSSDHDAPAPNAEKKKSPSRIAADRSNIQVWIPLSFPPVPKKGGWDVTRLRESKYFFS